jgi:hypothetical protein
MVGVNPMPLSTKTLTHMVILVIGDHSEPHKTPTRGPHGDLNAIIQFFGGPADALIALDP